ncbi:hypothetical protein BV20DRAFT_1036126 [Pilatotrama ljubarskyi]|nr:hypothetical protein BV20DRAFT_1036126 [Pilatotrama ljubarskyi]
MRRFLHSPDVLKNICEQAYEGGYDPDCRATVAALSATCRAIHRVATAVLWSRLFSLRPLLKCMPEDLWAEDDAGTDRSKGEISISLTRPPDLSEWDRFLANATLVTSFKRFGLAPDLDEDTYRTLCLYRPGASPILPNLRELSWEESDADVFEYAYQFLGSKLETLHLGQPPSDSLLLPILRSLDTKCPLLVHLSVQCCASIGRVDGVGVSRSISRLQFLETVDVGLPLLDDALLHLAMLPTLSVAKVFIPRIPQLHDRLMPASSPLFPVINVLHINAVCLEPSIIHLIRLSSSEHLTELRLGAAHDPSPGDARDFLAALGSNASKDVLSTLALSFPLTSSIPLMLSLHVLPPLDRSACVLDASVFRPLLACSRLTELEVNSFYLKLDNELVSLLANAFPRLQSLRLLPPYNAGRVSEVTLEGLLPLFRRCPEMTHLAVPVDASQPLRNLNGTLRPSELVTLEVADSPISFPDEVAAFLSAYCTHPSFSIASASAHEGDHDSEHMRLRELHSSKWSDVTRLIRLFVRVRSQERASRMVGSDEDLATLPPLHLQLS